MDLISLIAPVYNLEKLLDESIPSMMNQTYKNIEIILVNDGSKDKSAEICDAYAAKDSRIKVIHKPNGGVSSTRNRGLQESNGKYFCFVDPDDVIEPTFVERMYKGIVDSNAEMAACRYVPVGFKNSFKVEKCDDVVMSMEEYLMHILMEDEYGGGFCWNKMFRKDLAKDLFFDEKVSFGEDLMFIYEYMVKSVKNIYVCEEGLYYYINRATGLSKVRSEDKLLSETDFCYSVLQEVLTKYPSLSLFAYKRYLRIFSLLVVFCNDVSIYKDRIKEARKFFFKMVNVPRYSLKKKILIFIRLFFPKTIRFLVHSKRKISKR